MKNILFALIFTFALSVFNTERSYAECFLFDGTYIGAATDSKKGSFPLFIVVANKHITGFFAPEDQKTHGPGGSSFNLGGLTVSSVYTLSLTTENKILIMSADGTINGKAKLGVVEGGSGSFSGFYNSNTAGDFLNIGTDGGTILKVAEPDGNKVVHAFGKINSAGEFVQVFPEKGKGPHVTISFSGNTAEIKVTSGNSEFFVDLTKFSENSCNGNSSSSSGISSSKPIFVVSFLSALNDLSLLSSTELSGAESGLKALQDTIRKIKLSLLLSSAECSSILQASIEILSDEIKEIKAAACSDIASCPSIKLFTLGKMQEDQSTVTENISLDGNNNSTPDICEQDSVFNEKEALSIVSITFNNAIKDIDAYSKIVRKEDRKLSDKKGNAKGLFSDVPRLLKKIRTLLKTPASICNLSIQLDVEKLSASINNSYNLQLNLCAGYPIGCGDELLLPLERLLAAGKATTNVIKIDSNKNDIVDICE